MELPSEPDPTSKSSHNSSVRQLLLHKHLYLPHERMLHGVDRPAYLKILPAGDALKTLQLTGEVFPKCFAEIHPKTFLRKAIDGMLAGITKQVTRLSPYTFLATYAPLHSIEEAWKKNGAQLDSDVRLANSKATATPMDVDGPVISPPILSKKTIAKNRAAAEAEQLIKLKEYLRRSSTENLEMAHLSTSVHDVYAVVRGYCVVVLDRQAVFGSRRNEKVFQRGLKRYLQMGIADKMHAEYLVQTMDKNDFPWLRRAAKHNHDMFVAEFLFWIFSEVINPFIKRLFYVTSSQCGRKERCYFRRDIWDIVCLKAEHEYIENKLWYQLSDQPIQEGSLDGVSEKSMFLNFRRNMQPVYKTRYVPREVFGVRPIMVREKSELHKGNEYANKQRVRFASALLRYLIQRDKQLRGCGCSTTIEVQQCWSEFRQHRLANNDQRPLYFASCDIEKAYDNVHLGILRKLLDLLYHQCKAEELDFLFLYDVGREASGALKKMKPGDGPRFRVLSRREMVNFAEKHQYFQPTVINFERTFKDIDFMSKRAVFRSVKKNVWFTFLRGIPQGGPLSSLFLQLYVGALENEMALSVMEDELMMRYMDDILYVSPHQDKVRKFLALVLKGYPAAGVTFNPKKTYTNLPRHYPDLPLTPVSDQGVTSVSWYGWVFNLTLDLSLKVDMRRYQAFRLRYLSSISYSSLVTLRRSLTFCLMGKFAMALFDLRCGSLEACTENVYEMFVLCAMDLLAYWRTCQRVQRSSRVVLRLLYQMAYHLGRILTARQTVLQQQGPSSDASAIETLAWLAFATVLCLEGRSSSPLSRSIRRKIEQNALERVVSLLMVDASRYRWICSFISDNEKRFPLSFRSIPL